MNPVLEPAFRIDFDEHAPESVSGVRIEGRLVFGDAGALWTTLRAHLEGLQPGDAMSLDLSRLESADSGSIALLVEIQRDLARRGVESRFQGARGSVGEILALFHPDAPVLSTKKPRPRSALEQIGKGTVDVLVELKGVFGFFGSMLLSAIGIVREPNSANWRATVPLLERVGADAVPIVVLINFLVGFVMAFQGAVQLKQFGANIYVADLVGLSVCRELGPLMTAIIACGRSGAAFTAELGTMKVSEEIDALRTMGFGTMRFLVLPRALALMIALPLLTVLADVVGMLGGLVVGLVSLDLTVSGYVIETRDTMHVWDVAQGFIKSAVFALAIALIACQQGLATTGAAEGVGRRTTSSVVTGLFAIILIDAGMTMLFHAFGL
jgi:phospholipid/cholesterol/gamma-HCH transport system permease protein